MNYWRVEAVTPLLRLGDVEANKKEILKRARAAQRRGVKIQLFPELAITGYSCGDLFEQKLLLDKAEQAVRDLADELPADMLVVLGAPLRIRGRLYNCAVCYFDGEIVDIVTKTFLPNYAEYSEKRWFRSTLDLTDFHVDLGEDDIPLNELITLRDKHTGDTVTIGIEICEDLWAPCPPSILQAQNGAEIILNPCASTERGRLSQRHEIVRQHSQRLHAAYVMACAGMGESSADCIFAGNSMIYENGSLLGELAPFQRQGGSVACDIDVEALRYRRTLMTSYHDLRGSDLAGQDESFPQGKNSDNDFPLEVQKRDTKIQRRVDGHPFLPRSKEDGAHILRSQAAGLVRRMEQVGSKQLVIGVSGGLDSTLALLVCCEACDMLEIPRKAICGISMPGLGTSPKTRDLSAELMRALKVSRKTIDISQATTQHLKDIGHDLKKTDVVFENAQARERTQVIMDYANKVGGLVVGTGDMSELALGWCTYNGDHMSMYGVNAGVPKTLVRYLVGLYAKRAGGRTGRLLEEVLDIPISPELLPADAKGGITQKTEDIIGPYELHDFFLYQMLVEGADPAKIYALAKLAFGKDNPEGANVYTASTIKKWLLTFYRRFFASQFKRSCLPDGPKVGPTSLSPRAGWRMPSDTAMQLWIDEVKKL